MKQWPDGDVLDLEAESLQDSFFERGWTDGLPIEPPTPSRVEAMLASVQEHGDVVLAEIPERNAILSVYKAAINAVMAGCRPEYFPVVLAACRAMGDESFHVATVISSSGGPAFCVVVSGPIAAEIGMNGKHGISHNALGTGHRPNATIGRALRLIAINVLGAQSGVRDGSSFGNPGKFSLTVAEEDPPSPWLPLRQRLGYGPEESIVLLVPTEGPRSISNHLNGAASGLLRTMLAAVANPSTYMVGRGGQGVLVIGPEHAAALIREGWTVERVQDWLVKRSRLTATQLRRAGVVIDEEGERRLANAPDHRLATFHRREDLFLLTSGGAGAGWSAYMPSWSDDRIVRSAIRPINAAGTR